ncbi:hypothetical protein [Kutzneria sp. NPDC051319]|uniref:5'-methylthioadenosine/S-adenosylhomocysteine nucleosidase family protein n=1 Tax=Kutzneria sp. NPDC051319 TaxID=3155047 RepID=UPI003437CD0F
MRGTEPTWSQCRRLARSVRAARHGREAYAWMRPRAAAGMFRQRGPLPLLLAVAAAEGLLVSQGDSGVAVLEPPMRKRRRPLSVRWTVLRFAAQHWGLLLLAGPPISLLLLAIAAALLHAVVPALLVIAVLTAYLAAAMTSGLITQIVSDSRRPPIRAVANTMAATSWSLVLLHQPDDQSARQLFDSAYQRFTALVRAEIKLAAHELGGEVRVRVTDTLVGRLSGITTEVMRDLVSSSVRAGMPFGPGTELILMANATTDQEPSTRQPQVAFFWLYLFALTVLTLGLPMMIVVPERSDCLGAECAVALTDYGRALDWLVYQMLFQNVPGLSPSSGNSVVLGVLAHLLLPMTLLVGVVAARRSMAEHRHRVSVAQRERERMLTNAHVLIVVTTPVEWRSVARAAYRATGKAVAMDFQHRQVVYELGSIRDTTVSMIRIGDQGALSPGGSALSTVDAIQQVRPDYAILTGICYGLRPKEHRIGDVVLGKRVQDLDHQKWVEEQTIQVRGENIQPSPTLLGRCHAVAGTWTGSAVREGEMVSWTKLLNSDSAVKALREQRPDAIGGEMEGSGFHAAARREGVEWVIVKSISDWAGQHFDAEGREAEIGKPDDFQQRAADNAADFVLHMIEMGALSAKPSDMRR